MSIVRLSPSEDWKSVSAAGHELMVTGHAVEVEVWHSGDAWIMVGCSPYSDGERWLWDAVLAPGDERVIRRNFGVVIEVRRR